MYIGIRGHDFCTGTIEELAEKCFRYSIKHIQLALDKSIFGFVRGRYSREYAEEIGMILKNRDIKVAVLGCYINPSETSPQRLKNNLDYFIENLYYAKHIGADMVGLETGFVGETPEDERNNTEEAYQYLLANMKLLTKAAEKIGVKIGIEGVHCFIVNTPKKMRRLIDDLNSENACVIFDPVNYLNYNNFNEQEEIFREFFEMLSDKIGVVHLKDFKVENDNLIYEFPCSGLLNTQLIIDELKRINSEMTIIVEGVNEENLLKVTENIKRYTTNNV